MADHAGHPRPDLSGHPTDPVAMEFFELLRRLETPRARFGRAGGPGQEPARLGQRVRMTAATRDIAGFRPGGDGRAAEVDVEVLGLLGPEGPLPLHLTRRVLARLSDRWFAGDQDRATSDTTFLDFCNLLQHRMIALYWRAWADAQPGVGAELGADDRVQAMIDALAGLGLPGMKAPPGTPGLPAAARRHATSLSGRVQGPERLARFLSDVLAAPVAVGEFVGHWADIPVRLQTRIGRAYAALGRGAVAGRRTFQRQTRIELRVGPVPLDRYRRLIGDRALRHGLRRAILFAIGRELDVDLRLILARDAVPDPRLGQVQLGRTAWISPRRQADAADYRQRSVTSEGAAA